jgi:hypothetical protein
MPGVELYGHFVVVTSTAGPRHWKTKKGQSLSGLKRMALIEIYPEKIKRRIDPDTGYEFPSFRIDPRLKSIKQIIIVSDTYPVWGWMGKMFYKERERLCGMAERFDKLWPMHILAKDWPLRLYL